MGGISTCEGGGGIKPGGCSEAHGCTVTAALVVPLLSNAEIFPVVEPPEAEHTLIL